MTLETMEERVKLLQAGITGREIEKLYVIFNSFEIVGVNWQDGAVTKPVFFVNTSMLSYPTGVQAAPSRGARACAEN